MSEYHALLNYLRDRDQSISNNLAPYIEERLTNSLPDLSSITTRISCLESSQDIQAERRRGESCDESCSCRRLIQDLKEKYKTVLS